MTHYLYVKTHNVTGLKYLGTTENNPFKYHGSGKHWKRHYKKHGKDISTQILLVTECEEELIKTGLFFSRLWNVVGSNEWANLTEETGQGIGSDQSKRIQRDRIARGDVGHLFNTKRAIEHNKKMLKEGRHPSQDKTLIAKTNQMMLSSGTHPFQDETKMVKNRKVVKEYQLRAVSEGTHNFSGKVVCIDRNGVRITLNKSDYDRNKIGPIENWEYVPVVSREAKRRKGLSS